MRKGSRVDARFMLPDLQLIRGNLRDKKIVNEKFVLEFKRLLDGNYMVVVNGKEYSKRWARDEFTIDLTKGGKINLKHLKANLSMNKYWQSFHEEEMLDAKAIKIDNEKDIESFVQKYGWAAVEVLPVKEYLSRLVEKIRNKNTPLEQEKKCRKKFNDLITKLLHINKKTLLYVDFKIEEFAADYFHNNKYAGSFYKDAKKFCRDCDQATYLSCKKRKKCPALLEDIRKNGREPAADVLLQFNYPSKYNEHALRKKYNLGDEYGEVVNAIKTRFRPASFVKGPYLPPPCNWFKPPKIFSGSYERVKK